MAGKLRSWSTASQSHLRLGAKYPANYTSIYEQMLPLNLYASKCGP
jgi:hypothetical protein